MSDRAYQLFEEQQKNRGINVDDVKEKLKSFKIETPSWGYGDSGTRFKVFQQEGVPRDPFEKFEDAAQVHNVTGICPSVAVHIPWDKVDDYSKLKAHAEGLGMKIGGINPNLFQDDDYRFGSLTHIDERIRQKAVEHMLECVDIAREVDSPIVSLWLADGTNYPGQANIRQRKRYLLESLQAVYEKLDPHMTLLVEYKFFEPAFYHTDIADWGIAYDLATKLGEQAKVLVDTGHHAHGVNIEHIVSYLLDEQKIGGFHFNNRKYADDDLITGTINPYELFLIFYQMLDAANDSDAGIRQTAENIEYMIDQSHNIEPKIPAMIRTVLNVQSAYAKALLINFEELAEYQQKQDVLGAENALRRAFEFDVTPLLEAVREEMGVPTDPMAAYLNSDYGEKILARGKGGASW